MNFWGKLTVAVAVLILAMASTLTQDAPPPSCGMGMGCHEPLVCVPDEGNPGQAHCRRLIACPLIAISCICPDTENYTCKHVGETCQNPRAVCIPNKDLPTK